jgi:hypothetical protein
MVSGGWLAALVLCYGKLSTPAPVCDKVWYHYLNPPGMPMLVTVSPG